MIKQKKSRYEPIKFQMLNLTFAILDGKLVAKYSNCQI